jgi:hypothetical protein
MMQSLMGGDWPMTDPDSGYRSYLLRLWRAEEPGVAWRVMLESVNEPGQRHYFKDLESLMAYLMQQWQPPPGQAGQEGK